MEVVEQAPALLGVELDVAAQDVDVRLQARQRRAQLVRRIGDETALRLEGLLERAEHRVERRSQSCELVVPALGDALTRLAGLCDSLGRRGQPAHRSERRAGHECGQPRRPGRGPASETRIRIKLQPVERAVRRLQALDDEHGSERQGAEWSDKFAEANRHGRLATHPLRSRNVAVEASVHISGAGDIEDLSVLGRGKIETLRRGNEIPVESRPPRPGCRRSLRPANVTLGLHRVRRGSKRTVYLGLQLVTHHEVGRDRCQHDDEGDDASGDEREAGAKRHGSRST